MTQREDFLKVARSWLGRKESDGSHREIIDIYNEAARALGLYVMSYEDPWCAAFVTACAWECKLTNIIAPSAACDAMISWYKQHDEWRDRNYTPKPGDIVFYDWDGNNTSDHVGIVDEVNGYVLKVIEGNCSDSVAYRYVSTAYKAIQGFGVPKYTAESITPTEPIVEPVKPVQTPCTVYLPMLRKGAGMGDMTQYAPYVKTLQILLINNDYSCGGCGADGEFGNATDVAVRNYQTNNKLDVDGIVGNATWNKLLGG